MPTGIEEAGLVLSSVSLGFALITGKELLNLYHILHDAPDDFNQLKQEIATLKTLLSGTLDRAALFDELPVKEHNAWRSVLDNCTSTAKELEKKVEKYKKPSLTWSWRSRARWAADTVRDLKPRFNEQITSLSVIYSDFGMALQTAKFSAEARSIREDIRQATEQLAQRPGNTVFILLPVKAAVYAQLQGQFPPQIMAQIRDTLGIETYPWATQTHQPRALLPAQASRRIEELPDADTSSDSLPLKLDSLPNYDSSVPLNRALEDLRARLGSGCSVVVDSTADADGDKPIYFRNAATGIRTFFCPEEIDDTPYGWRKRLYVRGGEIVEHRIPA